MRDFLTKGGPLLIPFFCFCSGAGINLEMLLQGGLAGILLGILTTFIGGFLIFAPIGWSEEVVSLALQHPARPVTRWLHRWRLPGRSFAGIRRCRGGPAHSGLGYHDRNPDADTDFLGGKRQVRQLPEEKNT